MASEALLQFGQQLISAVSNSTTGSEALVLSPISLWFALVLLLNGAGVPSVTFNELLQAVTRLDNQAGNSTAVLAAFNSQAAGLQADLARQVGVGNNLTIANALWTKGIAVKPAYAGELQRLFKAQAAAVTDAAPINAWAARVTNGLIKQAVDPATDFDLVLTNAVYFKARWQRPFDSRDTTKRPFKALVNNPGSAVPTQKEIMVNTMKQLLKPELGRSATQKPAFIEVPGRYQAVRLSYKDSPGLAAIFVLPDSSTAIKEAAAAITAQELLQPQGWTHVTADTLPNGLELSLPKFRVEVKQLSLEKALQAMGVRAAFSPSADLSGISQTKMIVTYVLQSTVVIVDEEGTEAAAVTSIGAAASAPGDPPPPKILVFDRPFLFCLVDTVTQAVLSQGAVTDPSATP